MKDIDIKSLLIGVLLTLVIVLSLGASAGSSSQRGRYQVAAVGAGHQSSKELWVVVTDTITGKTKVLGEVSDKDNQWNVPFNKMKKWFND